MKEGRKGIIMSRGMIRLMATLAVMLLLLLAIGLFLYLRVNRLLNVYMEEQGKKQAETLSEVTSRQLEGELKALSTVASEFTKVEEVSVDALRAMQDSDHESRIGVQRVDGNPYYGIPYSAETFGCIENAIHGETAMSYVQGKGLMFCVPAFRDKNVAYVIYRIYPESQLYEHFGVESYSGMGRVCIKDRNGHVVIPAKTQEPSEKLLFTDQNVEDGMQELMRDLFTTGSAATFRTTSYGEQMLFAAEIDGSDFYLEGYVPQAVVEEGVKYVKMLVILVFLVLAALVFLGGFLLTRLESRAQESEKLRAASLVAAKSNAAKSDFLANMSHEIRTPINAMLGMNEMIIRESSDEQIKNYAGNIESAGKNLLSIINDILDFSKIEAGKMELSNAPYQLSSLLNDVSNMIIFRARTKNLQYFVDVDETTPDGLYGDEVRIRQVLVNVLTNAVKYTNEGSVTLHVGYEREEDREDGKYLKLIITVKDTGIGIREEDIKKLFVKFERVDLSQNKTVEGTGLGLAITYNILQLMGGDIRVKSEYGKGSVFTVVLPQKIVADEAIGRFRDRFGNAASEKKTYRQSFIAKNANILVVDDTKVNLIVIEGLLKKTQLVIDTALSGEEALRLTKNTPYDLILMDQRMPQMDGSEAMERIRAQEDGMNRETPVIALTADAVQGARARYLKAGFTDYLSKPVDAVVLETTLVKYLPPEKVVLLPAEEEAETAATETAKECVREPEPAPAETERSPEPAAGEDLPDLESIYESTDELSYEDALQQVGTKELLAATVRQFYEDIVENADAILQYLLQGDYGNYTIRVHALKSSARLIGATFLSAEARSLEEAGNRVMDGTLSDKVLKERTPCMLQDYRALLDILKPFAGSTGADASEDAPLISDDELAEAYEAIHEFAQMYDINSVDSIVAQLKEYRIPENEEERVKKIAQAARGSDWETLGKLTE
ncbi:MAG: response regulator [Lachnospiraceae bacterium]|nr:response regulator [Lachnospiraceae bacterium]